jgi:hypothetical protein
MSVEHIVVLTMLGSGIVYCCALVTIELIRHNVHQRRLRAQALAVLDRRKRR